jgi:hypothetical protein
MNSETLPDLSYLSAPNRGRIVGVGLSEDGNSWRAYVGMGGRSPGSRNRFYDFLQDYYHGAFIKTAVFDPNLDKGDPSKTIYEAYARRQVKDEREMGAIWDVFSNGAQTLDIAYFLVSSNDFNRGQKRWLNEGFETKFTSRITGAVCSTEDRAMMGRIVSKIEKPEDSDYFVYYITPDDRTGKDSDFVLKNGEIVVTTTYDGTHSINNGKIEANIDPNRDNPQKLWLPGNLEQSMDNIWTAWDADCEKIGIEETKANLLGIDIQRGSGRLTFAMRSIHPGVEDRFYKMAA